MIFKILVLFLLFFVIYVISIGLIQIFKKVGTQEARKILFTFIKNCVNSSEGVYCFPINLGFDEEGYYHSDVIEREFEPLHKVYYNFYVRNAYADSDLFYYNCIVKNPKMMLENNEIVPFLEAVFDDIFQRHIHQNAPSHCCIPNLVAVNLQAEKLTILVARNPNGCKKLVQFTNERYLNSQKLTENVSLDEKWID